MPFGRLQVPFKFLFFFFLFYVEKRRASECEVCKDDWKPKRTTRFTVDICVCMREREIGR